MTSTVSPNGNVSGVNPAKFTTAVTYNTFGQPLLITDALGRRTTFIYDANGNRLTETDANGHITKFAYDSDNELTQQTRADGSILRTGYDSDGNVVSQTDGLNHTTTSTYDSLNRTIAVTDPLNRKTAFTHDGAGNVTSILDAENQTTTLAYDDADQQIVITYSDGKTHNVAYGYDADGRRVSMTDGTGTSTYSYDSLHRMTQYVNGAHQSVGSAYDLGGRLTSISYPSAGHVVTRAYDAAGRMTAVTDWLGHATKFGYDADSNLIEEVYPNSTHAAFDYNHADELTGVVDRRDDHEFLRYSYTRDQIGQLTAENRTKFGYDPINRLITQGDKKGTWTYDAGDNLTKSPGAASMTYDAANELTSLKKFDDNRKAADNIVKFSYDARGNRVQQGGGGDVINFGYDEANRLISYGTKAAYAYNGDGLRMSKTISGGPVNNFTWDVAQGLPQIIQQDSRSYITGPAGLPVEQIGADGKTITFHHQDQLGSTRALTDAKGEVVATYNYDPYGNLANQDENGGQGNQPGVGAHEHGTADTPFRYSGQFLDSESGLYYLRARYYDPTTGQFISRDPAVAMTRAPYSYVAGNPLNISDPSGLGCGFLDPLGCVGAAWDWVTNNSDTIAAVAGVAAFIPGLDVVAIPIMVGASAISAYKHFQQCDYAGGALSLAGVLPGIGMIGRFGRVAAEDRGFVNLASDARTQHILNGDATGGGHLWPGLPGKTAFPESWSAGRVMHEISDLATDPAATRVLQGGRTVVTGTRDGVEIRVIIDNATGEIVTGYPTNLPRNR